MAHSFPGRHVTAMPHEFDRLVCEVQKHLGFLKAAGCDGVYLSEKSIGIVASWEKTAPVEPDRSSPASLGDVFDEYRHCRRCGLADSGVGSVFGAGPESAPLMLIGYFPEPGDAAAKIPYSGEQGELLTRIIQAMALDRDSVYISHTVKCLPPKGRPPNKWEARACRHHLVRQIRAIKPSMICLLGESAAGVLLGGEVPFALRRGKFHDFEGIPVMPTHDLAYVLAHGSAKRPVWEDMQKIMKKLEEPA